ncbi:outer membrane phospholipase A [unidentified eubacterium SCB49]|nr:outer membrane phospholipase A [unidentified eubacterium SCB49]
MKEIEEVKIKSIFPKMFMLRYVLLLIGFVIFGGTIANAQSISREQLRDSIKDLPYFSIHKDNYFITGVPTNTAINSTTANVKYQVSFKQIITRGTLPYDMYLFLTYTQKSFWNVYAESFPFRDINFNPSVAIGKPVFNKNDKLKGIASLALEHESNGRDSIFSRSWNRLTATYKTKVFRKTSANFKVWLPFGYTEGNPDLLEYVGLAEINLSHELKRDRLYLNLMLRKGLNFEGKGVVRSRIYFNPFKKNISNQFIMLEWYLGQAEGLLNYQNSSSMIRLGYVIKTNEFDFFK